MNLPSHPSPHRFPIERLPLRLLLAVTAAVDDSGVLLVTGTDVAEQIRIASAGLGFPVEVFVDGSLVGTYSPLAWRRIKVYAGGGDDVVSIATRRQCEVWGDAGNDTITGVAGKDVFHGGDGDDSLRGGSNMDYLYGDAGNDTLEGNAGRATLDGGAGDDSLTGGSELDMLMGGFGNDTLLARGGDDYLYPATGSHEILDGGSGRDTVNYYQNNAGLPEDLRLSLDDVANDGPLGDTTSNLLNIENVQTGWGNDLVIGNGKANQIYVDSGDDTVYSQGGDDSITSGAGNNLIDAGSGDDDVTVDGTDTVYGCDGDDSIYNYTGGGANALIIGGAGDDDIGTTGQGETILAGLGDDTIRPYVQVAAPVADLSGGGGRDTLINAGLQGFAGSALGASITLDDVRNDRAWGEGTGVNLRSDFEIVRCSDNTGANDRVDASAVTHRVWLYGSLGSDTLIGGPFNDKLDGGAGVDRLTGNGGIDTLYGGAQSDYLYAGGDGAIDIVNGASGERDRAAADPGDVLLGIEGTIT